MLHPGVFRRRAGLPLAGGVLIPALLALALFANCNDPQSPAPATGTPEFRGQYDPAGGALEFRIESSTGGASPLRLVATNLEFDATSQQLHAQVAIRNAGGETLPGPNAVELADFDPETVHPTNATMFRCQPPEPRVCPGYWEFVHRGTYGEDGALSPGETSTPIEWIFADPAGESFSFRALVRPGDTTRAGTISGSVFADVNGDGRRQPRESGIADVTVSLLHEDSTTSTTTDTAGGFEFQVGAAGLYEVVREEGGDCTPTTPSRRQVFIVRRSDGSLSGYSGIDFGCRSTGSGGGAVGVAGIVFLDTNRDGAFQVGEPGIANVLIVGATSCPTFAVIQTRTDDQGRYGLRLPPCPPYVITREPLPGFADTSPNPMIFPGIVEGPPIPVPPSDSSVTVLRANFGVARLDSTLESSVEGVVFQDANRNGVREDDEPGLPDVEVTASGLSCMTPVSGVTRTDAQGRYVLRQSDVHCALPWRIAHAALGGMCDTSPNPVDVGYDRRPDPRHYRVGFGVAPCDSLPGDSWLVVFVHWQNQGLPGRRLEIVELGAVRFTNGDGLAEFELPAGSHTLRAYVNVGGPPSFVDLRVSTRPGETVRMEVVDCLPCVTPR